MTSFQKELMTAIEEATMSTGLSADECIRQAIELAEKEKKEHKKSIEEKVDKYYDKMFKKWRN